jgi:hypothetical protein
VEKLRQIHLGPTAQLLAATRMRRLSWTYASALPALVLSASDSILAGLDGTGNTQHRVSVGRAAAQDPGRVDFDARPDDYHLRGAGQHSRLVDWRRRPLNRSAFAQPCGRADYECVARAYLPRMFCPHKRRPSLSVQARYHRLAPRVALPLGGHPLHHGGERDHDMFPLVTRATAPGRIELITQ